MSVALTYDLPSSLVFFDPFFPFFFAFFFAFSTNFCASITPCLSGQVKYSTSPKVPLLLPIYHAVTYKGGMMSNLVSLAILTPITISNNVRLGFDTRGCKRVAMQRQPQLLQILAPVLWYMDGKNEKRQKKERGMKWHCNIYYCFFFSKSQGLTFVSSSMPIRSLSFNFLCVHLPTHRMTPPHFVLSPPRLVVTLSPT